jgi:hypothetical protein
MDGSAERRPASGATDCSAPSAPPPTAEVCRTGRLVIPTRPRAFGNAPLEPVRSLPPGVAAWATIRGRGRLAHPAAVTMGELATTPGDRLRAGSTPAAGIPRHPSAPSRKGCSEPQKFCASFAPPRRFRGVETSSEPGDTTERKRGNIDTKPNSGVDGGRGRHRRRGARGRRGAGRRNRSRFPCRGNPAWSSIVAFLRVHARTPGGRKPGVSIGGWLDELAARQRFGDGVEQRRVDVSHAGLGPEPARLPEFAQPADAEPPR